MFGGLGVVKSIVLDVLDLDVLFFNIIINVVIVIVIFEFNLLMILLVIVVGGICGVFVLVFVVFVLGWFIYCLR